MLEARDVPAAYYWSPTYNSLTSSVDPHASTANNWSDPSGNRQIVAPGANDDLYFTGVTIPPPSGNPVPTYPTALCLFSAGSQFNGMHLVTPSGGYGGSGGVGVQLEGNVGIGTLELRTGVIIQNAGGSTSAEGSTLTVTQHFTWTGGILNGSGNAATVKIVGVTDATIGNGTDSSYTTGSDIKLLSGTILSASGSIILNNGAGLDIEVLC